MKILSLNRNDLEGGAARAAFRINSMLRENGIEVEFFCDMKSSDASFIQGPKNKYQKLKSTIKGPLDRLPLDIFYPQRSRNPWGLNWKNWDWADKLNPLDADLVHFHWISAGMVGMNEVASLNKPIIWTLHDMWAMTGGCHYTEGCQNYKTHCGRCPQLKSRQRRDASYYAWKQRLEKWGGLESLTLVSPSRWLADCFEESAIFSKRKCHVIHNPINTNVFKEHNRDFARDILNLPRDKKLLLFGAMSATTDPRKGFQFIGPMLKELERVYSRDEMDLVVLGASQGEHNESSHFRTHYMGSLHDDVTLSLLYSACDISLAPSTQENLSLAVQEALSCGTPVVAFRIGGMPDMVISGKNGYLAEPYSSEDLAVGVIQGLKNTEWRKAARACAVESFSEENIYPQYESLFQKILK